MNESNKLAYLLREDIETVLLLDYCFDYELCIFSRGLSFNIDLTLN
jgi:hypothetical protein